jgi:23S rRNA-/tRNA-specific pseudouridylate synthase
LFYKRPPWGEPGVPRDLGTLFEDGDVLVLAKASGLPVLPRRFFLENTLLYVMRQHYGAFCSPIHRLGRGTSGAILFALKARAARLLTTAMKERRIRKVYLALASGTSPGRSGFPIRKKANTWRSFAVPLLSLIRDRPCLLKTGHDPATDQCFGRVGGPSGINGL